MAAHESSCYCSTYYNLLSHARNEFQELVPKMNRTVETKQNPWRCLYVTFHFSKFLQWGRSYYVNLDTCTRNRRMEDWRNERSRVQRFGSHVLKEKSSNLVLFLVLHMCQSPEMLDPPFPIITWKYLTALSCLVNLLVFKTPHPQFLRHIFVVGY